MLSMVDWIWGILPYFFFAALVVWIYTLQERIENLERKNEDRST